MLALAGGFIRVYVSVLVGTSASVAVLVTVSVFNSAIVWSLITGKIGGVF